MCRPDDTTCLGVYEIGITWTTRTSQKDSINLSVLPKSTGHAEWFWLRELVSKRDAESSERVQTHGCAGDHGDNRRDCAHAIRRFRGLGNGRDASGGRRSSHARDSRPRHARRQAHQERSRGGLIPRLSEERDLVSNAVRQRPRHGFYRGSALVCRSRWFHGRSRPRGGGRRYGRTSHLGARAPRESPPPGSSWLIRLRA
jgi:hypothetical protein